MFNKTKKLLKKRKSSPRNVPPEPMSESSDDSSGSESNENLEEDYNDEDHIFLISSVTNLKRREIMHFRPLRTQSKKTPRIKGKPPDINVDRPLIYLEETKKLIGDDLLRDERKIKTRNPKKKCYF